LPEIEMKGSVGKFPFGVQSVGIAVDEVVQNGVNVMENVELSDDTVVATIAELGE
jgi:hypothetical protein